MTPLDAVFLIFGVASLLSIYGGKR
jgi:hypothetical protein